MKEIIDNYKISGDSFLQKSIMYIWKMFCYIKCSSYR